MIAQANPGAAYQATREALLYAVQEVLESGWYILGDKVELFEKQFAEWCGVAHGVGCANGTDAIELMLRALGAGSGKVVFTVSHTAVATVAAVERAGATAWLVDVEDISLTMSSLSLQQAVEECRILRPDLEPWGVLPVHLYGQPADMDALAAVADQNGLVLMEDCAQSHGARYQGRRTGGMGRAGAFSLYPTKNLGAFGDGGIVLTDDEALADNMRILRQYGWKERYISAVPGINSRLDPLQAAMLVVRLEGLEADNAARRHLAALYDDLLGAIPFAMERGLRICHPVGEVEHVYHQYVVRMPHREDLRRFLAGHDIGTAVHYPVPVHLQPAYMDRKRTPVTGGSLPVTERAASDVLSLPMYPQLGEAAVREVCAAIANWMEASA